MNVRFELYDFETLLYNENIKLKELERHESTDNSTGYVLVEVKTDDLRHIIVSTAKTFMIPKTTIQRADYVYVTRWQVMNK